MIFSRWLNNRVNCEVGGQYCRHLLPVKDLTQSCLSHFTRQSLKLQSRVMDGFGRCRFDDLGDFAA